MIFAINKLKEIKYLQIHIEINEVDHIIESGKHYNFWEYSLSNCIFKRYT